MVSSVASLNSETHELLDPLTTAADDHSIFDKIDVFYAAPKMTETYAALASQTDISFAWNSSASSIERSLYRSVVLTRKAWLENQLVKARRQPFMSFAKLEKWVTLPIKVVNVFLYVIFTGGSSLCI
ncbi:uncharacterized protein LOC126791231 isoform X2 [Argentina anserina]|uniref:uncharacterized protein LOC126791231 isoform X2 n=1 Tax=Argentina anserina TaxID=57926 RepID=UPI0021762859|nr:uncharacterized protein LOC126791231 isoform X2 [Potentilla anserina]